MIDLTVARAERLLNDRRRRAAMLPALSADDQAWAILLWLFIRGERREQARSDDLFTANAVSHPVGERWLALLQQIGLLAPATGDTVALTESASATMREYLAEA